VSGGEPKYISLAAVIEEGFPTDDLKKILDSAAQAAAEAGVMVVTGDTKVVERGKGDGIYLNTAGIGFLRHPGLSPAAIQPGDKVIISGNAGDHGIAVMLARHPQLLTGDIKSDCAPLNTLTKGLREIGDRLRVMRDPTRGGLATTLCEFVEGTELSIELDERKIPVAGSTAGACGILGLDPLYSANEGRLIAIVAAEAAEEALRIMHADKYGRDAAVIGEVTDVFAGRVVMRTAFGGRRILTRLTGAQYPRIC